MKVNRFGGGLTRIKFFIQSASVAFTLVFAAAMFGCNAENAMDGGGFGPGQTGGAGVGGTIAGSGGYVAGSGWSGTGGAGAGWSGTGGAGAGWSGTGGAPTGGTGATGQWVELDGGTGGACAAFSAEAEHVEITQETEVPYEVTEAEPVAIYMMLDQSGSMMIPDISIMPRWNVAYDAINAFVNDPLSANIYVALQYFPLPNALCDVNAYQVPDVPLGMLPGHATAIMTSLNTHVPFNNDTPIEPALAGATSFCQQYKSDPAANPDNLDCAVVLITDGMPSACNQDYNYISDIAGNAFNGTPSVYTFAIGMFGADFVLMNQIAEKGGTDCTPAPDGSFNAADGFACDVSAGMTLVQALEIIREYIVTMETRIEYEIVTETVPLECEWEIPPPPENENFDRNEVNVEFSPTGTDADKQIIGMVETEAECSESELSWHYDNPTDPKRIIACPHACDTIKAAPNGKINILLGCQTILLE